MCEREMMHVDARAVLCMKEQHSVWIRVGVYMRALNEWLGGHGS